MRSALALSLALLPTLALAAPTYSDSDKHKDHSKDKDYGKHEADDCKPEIKWYKDTFPFHFTSTIVGYAGPDQVVATNQTAAPGLEGAYGTFKYGLNSVDDVICYNISVYLKGEYQSPAVTATHIHEAVRGRSGPPRIAFPNPEPKAGGEDDDDFEWRYSTGCLWGPFTTGVLANGTDTGEGFTVAKLEADPSKFFTDTHTVEYPAGAIRGQLQWV